MIQKIALVILTVVVVVLLFSKPCNENKIRREKRYSLYMVVDSSERVHNDDLVLLNGKEIGILNEIKPNGNKKVLNLRIYDGVKLPYGAFAAYFENMIGQSYLSFTVPETSMINKYVSPNDTLNRALVNRIGSVDTVSAKVVMKLVKEVINEVDSSINRK
jgi:ABC-type transporter Mla subunit MlaD